MKKIKALSPLSILWMWMFALPQSVVAEESETKEAVSEKAATCILAGKWTPVEWRPVTPKNNRPVMTIGKDSNFAFKAANGDILNGVITITKNDDGAQIAKFFYKDLNKTLEFEILSKTEDILSLKDTSSGKTAAFKNMRFKKIKNPHYKP